jgi:hypothetical protein
MDGEDWNRPKPAIQIRAIWTPEKGIVDTIVI